jgi:hypothetical protein
MSGSTVRLFPLFLFGMMVAGTTRAQVPDYMKVSVGHPATTKDEIAQRDVLVLNDTPMNSSQRRVRKKVEQIS